MASPPASRCDGAPAEQTLLSDEILEDIFLLLESGYDLARASATCRAFRRVATGRRFLRRFLSLHPPPIVGFIDFQFGGRLLTLTPAEPPHRSAPAARAVAQAGDFTFSFLPGASEHHPNKRWLPCDARDGRFLLSRGGNDATTFLELVVCDPLYRRYVQIPPIPRDLVPRMPSCGELKSEPFLAPAEEVESDEDSQHFRVIYNWLSDYKLVSFVFSAATGKWRCATIFSFLPARLIRQPKKFKRYYACNCFIWVRMGEGYMLMLNPREMKFSLVELRHRTDLPRDQVVAIIDHAAEDRLGFATIVYPGQALYSRCRLDLYSRTCQNNGVTEVEWQRDNSIPLPEPDYCYGIIGAAEGYLLLKGYLSALTQKQCEVQVQHLTVDLKTLLVEKLCTLNSYTSSDVHPYASFPPPLSLPRL
ncbi:hypothetical protein PR202_gb24268 [Eleusine coracana subsp. coracana]|uniref:F-box domain-containing protein n=1 Tax=Eleusine coracana subsp. coracana TaxID=191504 RepID=A0AAV5FM10_ELECO|nr:hypothetical protein PR202_gb24268 [Eleusine coracana subsp. coracana]